MYRAARKGHRLWAPPVISVRATAGRTGERGRSVHDERQKPVFGESAEATSLDTLEGANGSGDLSGCGSGVHCDVRDNRSSTTVAPVHQVEERGRADAETERRGERAMVFCLLRGLRVQGAERQQDGAVKRADRRAGFDRRGLLRTGLGGKTEQSGSTGSQGVRHAYRSPRSRITSLTWCFPGRCTLTWSRRRFQSFGALSRLPWANPRRAHRRQRLRCLACTRLSAPRSSNYPHRVDDGLPSALRQLTFITAEVSLLKPDGECRIDSGFVTAASEQPAGQSPPRHMPGSMRQRYSAAWSSTSSARRQRWLGVLRVRARHPGWRRQGRPFGPDQQGPYIRYVHADGGADDVRAGPGGRGRTAVRGRARPAVLHPLNSLTGTEARGDSGEDESRRQVVHGVRRRGASAAAAIV